MSEIHSEVEFGAGTADETFDLEQEPATKRIEGRTPWQLARARLRRDRLSMVALTISALVVLMAVLAPILDWLGILKPNDFNPELIDPALGGYPIGPLAGCPGRTRSASSRAPDATRCPESCSG